MNYPRMLFIFGLLVVLIPFLGIPLLWKHIVTVALGIAVISISILLRSSMRSKKTPAVAAVRKSRNPRTRTASTPRSTDRLSSVMNTQEGPVVESAEPIDQPSVTVSVDTEESSHEQA